MEREIGEGAPLDGNAVAGMLRELFAFDVTVASLDCAGCGSTAELGGVRVFGGAMGAIFRCIHCDTAMLRVVRQPDGFTLDLRGARSFHAVRPQV